MKPLIIITAFTATLLTAAIFGFFYAWICSTMWGLDTTDPRVAIQAMQAMNTSVRNPVFAPAFFGTPFGLLLTGGLAWWGQQRPAALFFGAAAVVYFCGGLLLTVNINVPMNRALGDITVPDTLQQAREIWLAYSGDWQVWNITRTLATGTAFIFALGGVFKLGQGQPT